MKKVSIVTLALIITLALGFVGGFSPSQQSKAFADSNSFESFDKEISHEMSTDEKVFSDVSLEDEFDDSSVIVVLDRKTSEINKRQSQSLFGNISRNQITELTQLNETGKRNTDEMNFRQIFSIELESNSKENVLETIKKLEKIDGVRYAGPNYVLYPCTSPSDPKYTDGTQWGLNKISAPDAWNITTGDSTVKVGVIDTGIASHDDLNANLVAGASFVPGVSSTTDTNGHGTHVAGIIGAAWNNIGGAGVCQNVSLVPLRIAEGSGLTDSAFSTGVIGAINYATNNDIKILNLSWGGNNAQPGIRDAIENYKGLFVCAAGNDNKNTDTNPHYPSSYRLPNLISVGAIDSSGERAYYSNYGATNVDIFAPGGNNTVSGGIYSTYPTTLSSNVGTSGYYSMSGSSMSTPMVTGVAALLLAKNPTISAAALRLSILSSADNILTLNNLCVSGGRLNAYKALTANIPSGAGTVANPFIITTMQELQNIRYVSSAYFKLSNNIALSGQWTPIPNFCGTLDCNNYTISNLTITNFTVGSSETNVGLFVKNYGTIKNLKMTGVNISSSAANTSVWSNVGAVCGINEGGTIDNVQVSGSITVNRNYTTIGGIAGNNRGSSAKISNCISGATLTGYGDMGGIAGANETSAKIMNSQTNNATISHNLVGPDNRSIGGIAGHCTGATITYCNVNNTVIKNIGQTSASSLTPYMGIITGKLKNSTFSYVYTTNITFSAGTLTGNQLKYFGTVNWPWAQPWKDAWYQYVGLDEKGNTCYY